MEFKKITKSGLSQFMGMSVNTPKNWEDTGKENLLNASQLYYTMSRHDYDGKSLADRLSSNLKAVEGYTKLLEANDSETHRKALYDLIEECREISEHIKSFTA